MCLEQSWTHSDHVQEFISKDNINIWSSSSLCLCVKGTARPRLNPPLRTGSPTIGIAAAELWGVEKEASGLGPRPEPERLLLRLKLQRCALRLPLLTQSGWEQRPVVGQLPGQCRVMLVKVWSASMWVQVEPHALSFRAHLQHADWLTRNRPCFSLSLSFCFSARSPLAHAANVLLVM